MRRRQFIALAVLVLGVLGGGYLVFARDGGEEPEEVPLRHLVGQTVVARMGGAGATDALVRRARRGEIGAVIVAEGGEQGVRRAVQRLQRAAHAGGNPELLFMIDQEGGPVKRLPGPPEISPARLGVAGSPDAARIEGEKTGRYLAGFGINVDLAPVADVSRTGGPETLTGRMFGSDPELVARMATAFAEGLEAEGVAATAKHFPGLGLATDNPDFAEEVRITASREAIEADLTPFAAAIEAGVPLVMTSTAIYPALESNQPAAWSEPIIRDELRERLGFEGVVITDDLESPTVRAALQPQRAALRALRSGSDLVLFARSAQASQRAFGTLLRAARRGRLPRTELEEINGRILALKESLRTPDSG